ncbi:helix-turn-helix transcriptional regulator [Coraliomargarita parva]|uniref:helix-turn-helix transcriptional regulator n=1 Tax=Coraliomargarita parva TaxID=3014050 RepID=UPI0031F30A00
MRIALVKRRTTNSMNSPSDRLLRIEELIERLSISRRSIYRLIADGEFPRPIPIGRAARWCLSDVENYLERLKQQRSLAK